MTEAQALGLLFVVVLFVAYGVWDLSHAPASGQRREAMARFWSIIFPGGQRQHPISATLFFTFGNFWSALSAPCRHHLRTIPDRPGEISMVSTARVG
jgi:hypothetical protein